MTELSACDGSDEIKCHVANTGSLLDFVGDRVHGWERSSSRATGFGVVRIGFGAAITLSWQLVVVVLGKSGGELRRGTPAIEVDLVGKSLITLKWKLSYWPFLSRNISRYDFVIHGPLMPILKASAPTVYTIIEWQAKSSKIKI